jgi:hypothetical protein
MLASRERLAANEALFREVNERLVELRDGASNGRLEVLCECSRDDCAETIELELNEYESVRSLATHFVVSPGHETETIEHVVERRPAYSIVEKIDAVALVVETDPRTRTGRVH